MRSSSRRCAFLPILIYINNNKNNSDSRGRETGRGAFSLAKAEVLRSTLILVFGQGDAF